MKEKILEISKYLQQDIITDEEAQKLLLNLFSSTCISYDKNDMYNSWIEGYHRKVDEINGNDLVYFDTWIKKYRK
jgi:hypothetical protein